MKTICLVVVGLYLNLFAAFAQVNDSAQYKLRRLKLDEVNFVSSYYRQDGNNSAVTGGTGTEKLADISNNFDLKFLRYNKKQKKVQLDVGIGIDYYTSASSDNINPYSISSASSRDLRIYPSVTRTATNEVKRSSVISSLSYSLESDYISYGFGAGFSKRSRDKNSEFMARIQLYFDQVEIILPVELRTAATGGLRGQPNQHDYPWKHRNTFSTSFSFSRIVNERLQLMLLADITSQHGFLAMPFHRIYFKDGSLATERLPSSRFKLPVAIKANYFLEDLLILRPVYRFYKDDWGLRAHTLELETSFKITPFFSVTPFYRFYDQTSIDYFKGYGEHQSNSPYYSSNYNLSAFSSHFFGGGLRLAPPGGLFGKHHWTMLEIRYGNYKRSDGLHAGIISLHLKYK